MKPAQDVILGGRYRLNRRVAIGGMGEVWEATDTVLNRIVAVKIMKDELRTSAAFLARFRAEARHAGGLSHVGIASVFDYGESDDSAYIVMELVDGRPLSDLLSSPAELSTAAKLSILAQTADALHAAHQAGVIHRDVKPGNLLVRCDGTVKVTDFGIASASLSASLTEAGQLVGTVGYISPEQAMGAQSSVSSDVYALGVVAYEMFAGHRPFERDTPVALLSAHVHEYPPPLPTTVPPGVATLIMSALAKEPSMRPISASEFAAAVRREAASAPAPPPVGQHPGPEPAVSPSGPPTAVVPRPLPSNRATLPFPHLRPENDRSRAPAAFVLIVLALVGAVWFTTAGPGSGGGLDERTPDAGDVPVPVASGPPETTGPATDPPTTVAPATSPAETPAESVVVLPPGPAPATAAPAPATEAPAPVTQAPTPATQAPAPTPVTQAPTPGTQLPAPTSQPAPVAPAPAASGEITEGEAVDFVLTYYERLAAGEYEVTWEALSPEFRADRDLSFEDYVGYWTSTSIELDNLTFRSGPGAGEGRVRFDARYVIEGGRVVDETDEITLRRGSDGLLVITAQRTV